MIYTCQCRACDVMFKWNPTDLHVEDRAVYRMLCDDHWNAMCNWYRSLHPTDYRMPQVNHVEAYLVYRNAPKGDY